MTPPKPDSKVRAGFLTVELMVALAILLLAVVPLAYSFSQEQKLARAYYQRAVATEIVDGEMEILLAGEWRRFKEGSQPYAVRAESVMNLPPGRFVLTMENDRVRLDWLPERRGQGGAVSREARVK